MLKIYFFENLIVKKKLFKYMKIDFFNKKIIFCSKNHKQIHPKIISVIPYLYNLFLYNQLFDSQFMFGYFS